jgi:glucose-specific phosphotransferase system IIA component
MFDFMKKKKESLLPAMAGEVVNIEKVPDQVFSQKMLGDGYAIIPTSGTVVAPVSGVIVQIFPTNHAFGIVSESGLEVLVHIGIDTVELKGEGFKRLVEVDQTVKAGTPIIEIDLEFVKARAKSMITPVVITNKEKVKSITVNHGNNPKVAAVVEMV